MTNAYRGVSVDIAIPVLNEERVLAASVEKTLDYCREHGLENVSITIADNGSTDATPAVSRDLTEKWSQVRYIRLEKPALGAALQEAWRTTNAEIVGYMDADLATDVKHLNRAFALVADGDCDMAVASRLAQGATVMNRRLVRTITSHAYNGILKRRLRYPGSDAACGFKFMTRSCCERILASGELSEGLFFGSEIAVRAFALGLSVIEIPVVWTDERDSRIRVVPSAIQFWKEIGRLKRDLAHRSPSSQC